MREIGPVRFFFDGDVDAAKGYIGQARTLLGILKNQMSFRSLPQLSRQFELSDGTIIFCQSVFGQDTISIDAPAGVPVGAESSEVAAQYDIPVGQWMPMLLPNPVPYRGIVVGTTASTVRNVVLTSDNATLASELQVQRIDVGGVDYVVGSTTWSGGPAVKMFELIGSTDTYTYNHDLTFDVPEDCIYPETPVVPACPTGYDAGQWVADWNTAQAALLTRKTAWLKKNSDTVVAVLKAGAMPYKTWEFMLKRNAPVSTHTKRQIAITESYIDALVSDTSAGGIAPGTAVTSRTTTLSYTDSGGTAHTQILVGTHAVSIEIALRGLPYLQRTDTYSQWYTPAGSVNPSGVSLGYQFLRDQSATGLGLAWDGEWRDGWHQDSTFAAPDASFTEQAILYHPNPVIIEGYLPYLNTLTGAMPQFVLDWHSTVLPEYVLTDGSTAWNDSALVSNFEYTKYNYQPPLTGERISILCYGPYKDATLGMFGDHTGAVQTEVFGTATFEYQYADGSFKFVNWKDADSANATSKIIDLAPDSNNALVQYLGLIWPDTQAAAKTAAQNYTAFQQAVIAAMKSA